MGRSRIGVDPGTKDGAIALVEMGKPPRVTAWWAFSLLKAGYRLTSSDGDVSKGLTLSEVGGMVLVDLRTEPHLTTPGLVIEGQYIPPASRTGMRRVSQAAIIKLAVACGELTGPLRCDLEVLDRPLASEWRSRYGWTGLTADRAEMAAIDHARESLIWSSPPEGLTMVELGAVCESAFIALYERRTKKYRRK